MKAMYTAASGMDAQTFRIDAIANNLANANTTAFKKTQVDFADLMYSSVGQQASGAGGETRYTRDGSFRVAGDGTICTAQGYRLMPSMTVPSNTVAVSIGTDGTVEATTADGNASSLGQIQLANFVNAAGLSSQGNNLFAAAGASGTAALGNPGSSGLGELRQ